MKKFSYIVNLLFFLFFLTNNIFSRQIKWKEIIPANYLNKTKVISKGKSKIYYVFDNTKKISFKVLGPTIIRIYLKRLLTNKSISNVQCLLLKNNKIVKKINLNKNIDEKSHLKNNKLVLSQEKTIELNVEAGKQQYVLKLINKNETVLASIRFQKLSGKEKKYVYLSPDKYLKAVIVKQKDMELTYFKTTLNKHLVFDLIGPVELTLISRAIINKKTNPKTKYSYSILANKSKIKDNSFLIKKDKDAKIITTSKKLLKISKMKTYSFKLPAGSFRIEIKPLQKEYPLIFRVKIPQKYVKNTLLK